MHEPPLKPELGLILLQFVCLLCLFISFCKPGKGLILLYFLRFDLLYFIPFRVLSLILGIVLNTVCRIYLDTVFFSHFFGIVLLIILFVFVLRVVILLVGILISLFNIFFEGELAYIFQDCLSLVENLTLFQLVADTELNHHEGWYRLNHIQADTAFCFHKILKSVFV